jgi:hypothetical protein
MFEFLRLEVLKGDIYKEVRAGSMLRPCRGRSCWSLPAGVCSSRCHVGAVGLAHGAPAQERPGLGPGVPERGAGAGTSATTANTTAACCRNQEAMKNSISSQLRFAALHDCETKWKQCGKPSNVKKLKGKIDR